MEARKIRPAAGSTLTPLVSGKTNANLIALSLGFVRDEQPNVTQETFCIS